MSNVSVNVWVSPYSEYVIPESILSEAKALNGLMPLSDKRTKGYKYLSSWASCQDDDAKLRIKEIKRDLIRAMS